MCFSGVTQVFFVVVVVLESWHQSRQFQYLVFRGRTLAVGSYKWCLAKLHLNSVCFGLLPTWRPCVTGEYQKSRFELQALELLMQGCLLMQAQYFTGMLPAHVLPITSCSMGCPVQEWTSNIQNNFFHFLPNKLQLLCHPQVSRPSKFSPFQCSKCFISHASSFLFRKSQWLIKSRKNIMGKCVHSSFSNNSF